MTTVQICALIWLAVVFGLSLWQHINLGLIMIPASFILAQFAAHVAGQAAQAEKEPLTGRSRLWRRLAR